MRKFPTGLTIGKSSLSLAIAAMAGCASVGTPDIDAPRDVNTAAVSSANVTADRKKAAETESKANPAQIYHGTGVMVNTPKPEAARGDGNVSLNFEAADVRDIAKTVLAEILKESYIVDPKVGGTITFRTVKPLPQDALLPTLETVLRMNGIILVKENGIYKIMPAAGAKGSLSPRMAGAAAGFSVQIVPLKYVGSVEMAKILEGFSADPSAIKADTLRNLLILSGTQNEIQHMLDTIDMFDVDWLKGMSIGLFTLQSADVKTVDAEFSKILGDKNGNPLAGAVRVVPIERLNAFVIISPQPYYLEQAKIWLDRLDHTGGTGGTQLFVYHVQNSKAEHLAELMNQAFAKSPTGARPATNPSIAPTLQPSQIQSSTGMGATNRPIAAVNAAAASSTLSITDETGTSEVRIVADKETNTLLILANKAGYDRIESAIKRLDEAPRQVLIEVMIVEVTLTDEFQLGVEWTFTHGSQISGKLDVAGAGIGALAPGFSLLNTKAGAVQAALNMLATNGKVNVLSSPHIMVADNQTAKIQVGDSIPINQTTLNSSTNYTYQSTTYLDTGVILSVTPRINAGGLVNLEVEQEFSVPGPASSTGSAPPISKRSAKTKMTAQSGETMVLGGMISEKSTNSSSGLPFLSAIPVLGGLFGTTDRATTKTELIVLITPRVANNATQAKAISDELRRKMGEAKDLADCGTANLVGYTGRGGLWCVQPGRFEGAIDRMKEVDADGKPLYIKEWPSAAPENFWVPKPQFQNPAPAAKPMMLPLPLPSDPVPTGQAK